MLGLTIASIMFVVFALIIWRSMGTVSATAPDQSNQFPEDPSEIPDIADLEQGASMFVTIVDKNDPTRVAGTLKADQFEPVGGGRRRLVNPDAWIYMRDGRRIRITADDGLVMMPDPNEAPDSGTLEGNVTIQSFNATQSQTDPLSAAMGINDSASQTPSLVAKFDEPVEFERRYQRLTSGGRFTINSPGLDFIGYDLTVMLNEVKGRVELIDVRRGEQLILRPAANKDSAITQTKPRKPAYRIATVAYPSNTLNQDSPAVRATTQTTQPSPQDQQKTPYHIEIIDDVLVDVIGTGTLKAEALDVWAMLIDGALSPQAVKEIKFSSEEPPTQSKEPATSATPSNPAAAPAKQPTTPPITPPANTATNTVANQTATQTPTQKPVANSSATQAVDGEVVITWAGPLVVRPVEDPSETALSAEELALQFTSTTRVIFESSAQGIQGSTDKLTYGATQGILELTGSSDNPTEITADQAGTLRSESLHADMESGIISIDSQGQLESIQATDRPRAKIDWGTSAEFGLVKTTANELTGRLKSAYFEGQVLGTRADAVLRTETLLAQLDDQGPIESALRSIAMNQGSMQSDSGSLTADAMTIGFVPVLHPSSGSGGSVTPSTLNAQGAVLGSSIDGRVETDALTAIMVREFDGQTRVRRASATGNTEFLGKDDTHATGQRVDLNTDNDSIHIVGQSNALASAGQGGSLIHGQDIWINTRARSIHVNGPGTFDHDIAAQDNQGIAAGGHLRVSWNESMRFDDALGSIECSGEVVAVSTPDAYTIDTLNADRLEIDLTPAPGNDQITDPNAELAETPERELYEARAYGRAVPGGDPVLANVESRTYDPQNPERAIGVMYLEGPQLLANNKDQTLRVPTAGMMVLMDRSKDDAANENKDSATVMPSTSGPGLTRMSWLGSMELDRASGNALVLDSVNIRHKSLATGNISQIECDRLDAAFASTDSSTQAAAITMQSADASGNVRFTDLQRTLLSDHALYDAVNETLFAFADGNRLVTLRDSAEPAPVSAKTLLWDLKKDLVEIDAPSPVRAPARP